MGHRPRVLGLASRPFARNRRHALLVDCALLLGGAWLALPARADEASGTWTFVAEGRGNAFFERSSRVVVPELELRASTPDGLRLSAAYLVDVISSASIAQAGGETNAVFTELRHGADAGIAGELELGSAQLELGAHGTLSVEDDYTSVIAGVDLALALAQRTTILGLSLSYVRDHVESNLDRSFEDSLRGVTGRLSLERVINPWLVLSVGYQLAYLEGFLANPYRRALVGPLPQPEMHPRERVRHNATARLAISVPATESAVHLLYRAYADTWNIAALGPEARIYQRLGADLMLQLRYRFYTQSAASFYRRSYPVGWDGYVTNDPKMTALHTHTVGASLELRLGLLAGGALDFARDAWLDLAISRYFSTSAYGDVVIVTAGCRAAF